jgi:hypothetical protein
MMGSRSLEDLLATVSRNVDDSEDGRVHLLWR